MIVSWQPLFTDYEMISFWNSFAVFLYFLIIPMLANLVIYARSLRKREWAESPGRILGRSMAVVGGLINLFGVTAPLGSVHFVNPMLADYSPTLPHDGGWIVLVFGLLWFAFFAVPKKVAAIWGLVWGGLSLVFILVTIQGLADIVSREAGALYLSYGVYVTILGSLLLIVGSTLAYLKVGLTSLPEPIPPDAAAPPTS